MLIWASLSYSKTLEKACVLLMIGRNNCYFKQDLKDSFKKNKIKKSSSLSTHCFDIFHLNLPSVL